MAIPKLSPEEYLKERVDAQMDWMAQRARGYKSSYMRLRLLQISLGIIVSALGGYASGFEYGPQLLSGLGALISLAAAWETVNDYQNNWVRYRRIKEDLKREKLLYQTDSGPYRRTSAANDEAEASFTLFVSRVEGVLGEEVQQWSQAAAAKPPAGGTAS
jgi:hypothetical protein